MAAGQLPAQLASAATRNQALATVAGLVQLARPLSLITSVALREALVRKALPARATVASVAAMATGARQTPPARAAISKRAFARAGRWFISVSLILVCGRNGEKLKSAR